MLSFVLAIAEIPAEQWDNLLWNKFYSSSSHKSYSNLKSRLVLGRSNMENIHIFDCQFTRYQNIIIEIKHYLGKRVLISRSNFYDNLISDIGYSCIKFEGQLNTTIIYCCFEKNRNNVLNKGVLVRGIPERTISNLFDCEVINNGELDFKTNSALFYYFHEAYITVAGLNISNNRCHFTPSFDLIKMISNISYTTINKNTAKLRSIIRLSGVNYKFDHCNFMENTCNDIDVSVIILFEGNEDASCIISNSFISLDGVKGLSYPNDANQVKIINRISHPSYTYLSFFLEIQARTPINTPKTTPQKTPNSIKSQQIEPTYRIVANYIHRGIKQMIA